MRLQDFDYTRAGAYFVTIVSEGRCCRFGEVVDGVMHLNEAGRMVDATWQDLPSSLVGVDVDTSVVMPNHVHAIIVLPDRAPTRGAPTDATDMADGEGNPHLGDVVGAFNSLTTVAYARGVRSHGWTPFVGRLWQRNYYEHVIRDEDALNRIRQYVADNPACWIDDPENPDWIAAQVSFAAILANMASIDDVLVR